MEEAFQGGRRSVTLDGPDGRRMLEVKIPAGVTNGQRIRLAGQGGRGSEGARNGDLYFVVRIAPHPRYRVEGRDLYVDLPLAPWEAALGTSVAVETPRGEMKVKVPSGTSSGKRLRLRHHGLPHPRGSAGHLYAEVKIVVPAKLTDDERRSSRSWPRSPPSTRGVGSGLRADPGPVGPPQPGGVRADDGHAPGPVRRLVALGVLDADRDAAGELWFDRSQVAVMGRVQRLRAGFGLNYAAVGLVTDLLDRIAVLETALQEARRPGR